jgi:release factor glutamine methyltransferase
MLALLSECPRAIAVGTDCDPAALALARRNAERLGLAGRTLFVACDFAAALGGGFDLVVSNPPYIPTADIAALAPEVRDFDPHLALDGGADGLAAYRAIAADGARVLAPGGTLVVEVGIGQADEVGTILAAAGLIPEGAAQADLAGIPRAVSARRNP